MPLRIRQDIRTPNFDDRVIPLEFIVIHYTACSLERTLTLLTNPERKASAHLVIDRDGAVYELVQCLNGVPLRAWHSGPSELLDNEHKKWETFNDFSIGIELVNENGNIFPYSEEQYRSLTEIIATFQEQHPVLKTAGRVIGHEQIAGFRGKSDPGICFDWKRVLHAAYPNYIHEIPRARLTPDIQQALKVLAAHAPITGESRDSFFSTLSLLVESIPSEQVGK